MIFCKDLKFLHPIQSQYHIWDVPIFFLGSIFSILYSLSYNFFPTYLHFYIYNSIHYIMNKSILSGMNTKLNSFGNRYIFNFITIQTLNWTSFSHAVKILHLHILRPITHSRRSTQHGRERCSHVAQAHDRESYKNIARRIRDARMIYTCASPLIEAHCPHTVHSRITSGISFRQFHRAFI